MNGDDKLRCAAKIARLEQSVAALEKLTRREFELRDREVQAALIAAQRAVDKAESSITEQLRGFPESYARREQIDHLQDDLKEIRASLSDALTRNDFIREHKQLEESLDKDVSNLQEQVDDLKNFVAGRRGLDVGTGRLIAWVGGAVGVITLVVLIANHSI